VSIITNGSVIRESTIADLLRQDEGLVVEAVPLDIAQAALEVRWRCEPNGTGLSVQATREDTPEIVRRLIGAGVDVFGVHAEQRNLEEVFLSMTREDQADA